MDGGRWRGGPGLRTQFSVQALTALVVCLCMHALSTTVVGRAGSSYDMPSLLSCMAWNSQTIYLLDHWLFLRN